MHATASRWVRGLALASLAVVLCAAVVWAADTAEPHRFSIADGQLKLTAPGVWQPTKPATNIVEYEFAVPASDGDTQPGRVTIMGAGGGVDANLDRWYGQFSQPDGGSTRDRAKLKQVSVAGEDVHLVDISGTFKDQRGPFAPAVEREKYRMLAAIIATKKMGTYFIKFYGPQRTVSDHEANFTKLVESLEHK